MQIGHTVLRYPQVASTNDIAWQYIGDFSKQGLVVLADEQTAGRGRRGDQWLAPPGSAILLSMLLQPPEACRRPVILTLWAALGVCQVIEQATGLCPRLKWPNDILVENRKVCGIIVEQRQEWVVVGVGLNVNMPGSWLCSSRLPQAGSLNEFTAEVLDLERIFQALLKTWNGSFDVLSNSERSGLLEQWHRYSQLVEKNVTLGVGGIHRQGRLISLEWDRITLNINGTDYSFAPESITKLIMVDQEPG